MLVNWSEDGGSGFWAFVHHLDDAEEAMRKHGLPDGTNGGIPTESPTFRRGIA